MSGALLGAELPALREAFAHGLPPGESIRVKAPFTTDDGGNAFMWPDVSRWDGDAIEGLSLNGPGRVTGLHPGQSVKTSLARVFDGLHRLPDGHAGGGTTDASIARMGAGPRFQACQTP